MHCYQHREQDAIGLCKHCSKAVCETCARDTQNGLACSDYCASEVTALFQVTERAKRIYRIGKKTRAPSNGATLCYAMAFLLIANGAYPLLDGGRVSWIEILIGIVILGYAAYLHKVMSASGNTGT